MHLADFDYDLPKEMIAQRPLKDRDQSRLMVLNREGQTIEHHHFFELPALLDKDSVLVLNESKVIPARLRFRMGNGHAEILLIKPVHDDVWECMVRPGHKFEPKTDEQIDPECSFHVKDITPHGLRTIKFICDNFKTYLQKKGHTPTPPYIKEEVEDPEVYQTVYAKEEGSVAAPTAGFHFTQRVFADLKKKGIQTEYITLHVGLGTFQPVKTDDITEHQMHSEWFSLPDDTAERLNQAKKEGKKIVAVGTTSVRVLETCSNTDGQLTPYSGETDIFIYPGYQWKFVDQLITNFHVPKSTLVMLVSSFASFCHSGFDPESVTKTDGRDFIFKAYETAKKEGYRFFSFGDSMLIR
ncbi:tRNA preQ1(34) S-adenosylmethionine ribosyltransferase-isomerase QueA [Candidatus Peregrinibacteria bacterium]|nr:tRNA preQ1(34) S-adenosylmethionine ribosyltransferase-isomerase QueA [Candidatus Peregrinibacteria bacterium]